MPICQRPQYPYQDEQEQLPQDYVATRMVPEESLQVIKQCIDSATEFLDVEFTRENYLSYKAKYQGAIHAPKSNENDILAKVNVLECAKLISKYLEHKDRLIVIILFIIDQMNITVLQPFVSNQYQNCAQLNNEDMKNNMHILSVVLTILGRLFFVMDQIESPNDISVFKRLYLKANIDEYPKLVQIRDKVELQYEFTEQTLFNTIGNYFNAKYNEDLKIKQTDFYNIQNSGDMIFINKRVYALVAAATCLMFKYNEVDSGVALFIMAHQFINTIENRQWEIKTKKMQVKNFPGILDKKYKFELNYVFQKAKEGQLSNVFTNILSKSADCKGVNTKQLKFM